jgi:hypothetical protein
VKAILRGNSLAERACPTARRGVQDATSEDIGDRGRIRARVHRGTDRKPRNPKRIEELVVAVGLKENG